MNKSLVYFFPKEQVISLTITSVLIIIVAVPANILVLFGYLTSRSTRTKPSSILLVSMTLAELLISAVVVPFQLVEIRKPELPANNRTLCTFVYSVHVSFYITFMEVLACMSVDRYLAVKSMLRYSRIMTKKRVIGLVVFTWIHAVIFGSTIGPFLIRFEYNNRIGACGIVFDDRIVMLTLMAIVYSLAPLVIIVVFNYKMVTHLRQHNRRILHQSQDHSIDTRRNNARQGMAVNVLIVFNSFNCPRDGLTSNL